MTPYKDLLGLQKSDLSDEEIILALENASFRANHYVEFKSAHKNVKIYVNTVNPNAVEEKQNR